MLSVKDIRRKIPRPQKTNIPNPTHPELVLQTYKVSFQTRSMHTGHIHGRNRTRRSSISFPFYLLGLGKAFIVSYPGNCLDEKWALLYVETRILVNQVFPLSLIQDAFPFLDSLLLTLDVLGVCLHVLELLCFLWRLAWAPAIHLRLCAPIYLVQGMIKNTCN